MAFHGQEHTSGQQHSEEQGECQNCLDESAAVEVHTVVEVEWGAGGVATVKRPKRKAKRKGRGAK